MMKKKSSKKTDKSEKESIHLKVKASFADMLRASAGKYKSKSSKKD